MESQGDDNTKSLGRPQSFNPAPTGHLLSLTFTLFVKIPHIDWVNFYTRAHGCANGDAFDIRPFA